MKKSYWYSSCLLSSDEYAEMRLHQKKQIDDTVL